MVWGTSGAPKLRKLPDEMADLVPALLLAPDQGTPPATSLVLLWLLVPVCRLALWCLLVPVCRCSSFTCAVALFQRSFHSCNRSALCASALVSFVQSHCFSTLFSFGFGRNFEKFFLQASWSLPYSSGTLETTRTPQKTILYFRSFSNHSPYSPLYIYIYMYIIFPETVLALKGSYLVLRLDP